jgi:hypothetical protein
MRRQKNSNTKCTLSLILVSMVSITVLIEICIFYFIRKYSRYVFDDSIFKVELVDRESINRPSSKLYQATDWLFKDLELELVSQIDNTVYMNKYGMYILPKYHSRPAINVIKRGQVWEHTTLSFVKKNYQLGTDIVHAGAYFGDMLPFYSNLVGHSNKVWAFEPILLHFICAEKTVQLNGLQNVVLRHGMLRNKLFRIYLC